MPEPTRSLKAFLSYASQDKPLVKELSRRLMGEGWVDTWLDEKNLLPGQDWRVKIEEAVEESDIVIICLSTHSVTKEGYVQKELRYAREIALEKPEDSIFLIPLRLNECDVPRGLRFYQWVDYFGENKDDSYNALIASLKLRYEQKLKMEEEEAERFRKEKIEREAAEKTVREKMEKEVAEKVRLKAKEEEKQRITKEKAEREAAERERKEKELRKKQAHEASEKAKLESQKAAFNKKEDNPPTAVKPKVSSSQIFSWIGGFAVLILGVVLFSSLNNPLLFPEPTPENTQLPIITLTHIEIVEPSATLTPTSTIASTLTSTPLPTVIIDTKGVPMALIPAGEFIMGSVDGEDDAISVHTVLLDTFYMDKYEVTNAFYKDCLNAGACSEPRYWVHYVEKFYTDHPVVYVKWTQADEYCKWRGGSLPTEAQWERAARGVDGRTYPWGEGIACDKASYRSCNKSDTEEVGRYESGKSPYGIYDMAGSVWEWVADWYDDKYYQYSPLANPLGPLSGTSHVLRGGAWSYRVDDLKAYNRRSGTVDSDVIGFRCAKDAP